MSVALWPIVGAFVAAIGSAFLAWKLIAYRAKPGALWFSVTLASQTVFCVATGVAFLVFDPVLRWLLEILVWSALSVQVVAYLAFALSYSGRQHLVETRAFGLVFVFPLLTGGLMLTNPYHGLIWPSFRLESVAGLATVHYAAAPVGVALVVLGIFAATVAALVLLDTAISYSLYRVEALAIAVSTLPPAIAEVVWLLGFGPFEQLNIVPLAFIPHLVADGYAILATDMFEFNPATRRVVDNNALDRLESPVVVVNADERVINLNRAASAVFGTDDAALKAHLDELVGTPVDLDTTDQTIAVRVDGSIRHFVITPSEHTDSAGTVVGHSVVFQDITVQRRREQRLDVLNRVLRHNIRNDLNVVLGNLQLARETAAATDGGRERYLATAERNASTLLDLAEDARRIDHVVGEANVSSDAVSLEDVVSAAVADSALGRDVAVELDADADGGTDLDSEVSGNADPVVETDPDILGTMVSRLLAALVEYTDSDVTVRLATEPERYGLRFHTATPLPAHEAEAVESGSETALQHASSLDLWMVRWGAERLGCELSFGGRATATVWVPSRR